MVLNLHTLISSKGRFQAMDNFLHPSGTEGAITSQTSQSIEGGINLCGTGDEPDFYNLQVSNDSSQNGASGEIESCTLDDQETLPSGSSGWVDKSVKIGESFLIPCSRWASFIQLNVQCIELPHPQQS